MHRGFYSAAIAVGVTGCATPSADCFSTPRPSACVAFGEAVLSPVLGPGPASVGATFDHSPDAHVYETWRGTRSRRSIPVDGHNGTDFLAPIGREVLAPIDGVVTLIPDGVVRHCPFLDEPREVSALVIDGQDLRVVLRHLDTIAVRVGQAVVAGEEVGTVGEKGCASGPHLHLRVDQRKEGGSSAVDPFGHVGGSPALFSCASTDAEPDRTDPGVCSWRAR